MSERCPICRSPGEAAFTTFACTNPRCANYANDGRPRLRGYISLDALEKQVPQLARIRRVGDDGRTFTWVRLALLSGLPNSWYGPTEPGAGACIGTPFVFDDDAWYYEVATENERWYPWPRDVS